MKRNILNLFGLGKTKFSASSASFIAIPVYLSVVGLSDQDIILNTSLFSIVLLWCVKSLIQNKVFAREDPKEVVADEFLGMYICLLIADTRDYLWLVLLFVAFRLVDILKPPPFSLIDKKFKNGFGVMADDIAIGIFLGILFRLMAKFIL